MRAGTWQSTAPEVTDSQLDKLRLFAKTKDGFQGRWRVKATLSSSASAPASVMGERCEEREIKRQRQGLLVDEMNSPDQHDLAVLQAGQLGPPDWAPPEKTQDVPHVDEPDNTHHFSGGGFIPHDQPVGHQAP